MDEAEVEEVRVGVVAVDFEDLEDEPSSRSALDLNHDIQRITDVCFNRAVRKLHPALQHAAGEPCQSLLGGIRVNGGNRSRVTCIHELQQIEGLS